MKTDIKFNLDAVKAKAKKLTPIVSKHGSFAAILVILVIYLFVVWRISSLASAEPSDTELLTAETSSAVPKIDAAAIKQIQSLEQNSAQVKALFNQARNNPFNE